MKFFAQPWAFRNNLSGFSQALEAPNTKVGRHCAFDGCIEDAILDGKTPKTLSFFAGGAGSACVGARLAEE